MQNFDTPELESENRFLKLFENSPDAMFILDSEQRTLDCNNALVTLLRYRNKARLLATPLKQISPPVQPDGQQSREKARRMIQKAFEQGNAFFEWTMRRLDGMEFPCEVSLTAIPYKGEQVVHVIIRDISRYKNAERALIQSQRSLSNLMSNLPGMAYRCRYDEDYTMEFVSEGCYELTGYTPADFIQNNSLRWQSIHQENEWSRVRREMQLALQNNSPYRLTYRIITANGREKWVMENGRGVYDEHRDIIALEGLIVDITERVLSYQLLEQRVQKRTRQFFTLLDVSRTVASTLKMENLLDLILEQLGKVVSYQSATIRRYEDGNPVIIAHRTAFATEDRSLIKTVGQTRASREVLASENPVIIPDIQGGSPLAIDFQHVTAIPPQSPYGTIRCWMGVRLVARDRVIGILSMGHQSPNYYSIQQAHLTAAFANHAAVAIENATLYEQARELAAYDERQRLARELHDSVTQTLFSARLIADVLPDILKNNPDSVPEKIQELRELARGALAEMRTLLMELRPNVLVQTDLSELIQQLVEATIGRARLPIELTIRGTGTLIPAVQIAVYRITQEALTNISRHSKANRAGVSLNYQDNSVRLVIRDDGQGFDLTAIPAGHMGIEFMYERARSIGAYLYINSLFDEGTEIILNWTANHIN